MYQQSDFAMTETPENQSNMWVPKLDELLIPAPIPKVPSKPKPKHRIRTSDYQKRNRTIFTDTQIRALEAEFSAGRFISRARRIQLSDEIKIPEKQVKIWFQNRRMKYNKTKNDNDNIRISRPMSTSDQSQTLSPESADSVQSNNVWAPEHPNEPYFTDAFQYANNNHYDTAPSSTDNNLGQNFGSVFANDNNLNDIIETYLTNNFGRSFDNKVDIPFDSNFNNIGSSSINSCNNLDCYRQSEPPTINSTYDKTYPTMENFSSPYQYVGDHQYVGVGAMPCTKNQEFDTFYNFDNDFF